MKESIVKNTHLLASEGQWKQQCNTEYLLELTEEALLFPFRWQAGITGTVNRKMDELHGGWDAQSSHIRGTFTGHWMSAAAYTVQETGNRILKARLLNMVDALEEIQRENGGEWVFPIPEVYVTGLQAGKNYWAPLYVCHKVLMGLMDTYEMTGNEKALEITVRACEWFIRYVSGVPGDILTKMMDRQETGGLMELFAQVYQTTGEAKHLGLMKSFERTTLFETLLEGKDVLTNMHANSTIPEIHGAARAYEATGEERYRTIAENYWRLAVTDRGMFATGGQTCGEVWTPMGRHAARLGDSNQEHCVVYNMIRLTEYISRWNTDSRYGDYIERNILNGLFAQGYWQAGSQDSLNEPPNPETKTVCYYLPLRAGGSKKWGTRTESFWCCHCTLVQAHSRLREFIYKTEGDRIYVEQFLPSGAKIETGGHKIGITQELLEQCADCNKINEEALTGLKRPKHQSVSLELDADGVFARICIRIPWWCKEKPICTVDGEPVEYAVEHGYGILEGEWRRETICWQMPKELSCWPLPDEPETVAFLDGPVVLAGIVGEERLLYGDIREPATMLRPSDERHWGVWQSGYKTHHQQFGFYFKPLKDVGEEQYTVYFPVEQRR